MKFRFNQLNLKHVFLYILDMRYEKINQVMIMKCKHIILNTTTDFIILNFYYEEQK